MPKQNVWVVINNYQQEDRSEKDQHDNPKERELVDIEAKSMIHQNPLDILISIDRYLNPDKYR